MRIDRPIQAQRIFFWCRFSNIIAIYVSILLMQPLQAKGSIKRRAYSLPVLVILVVITLILARGTWEVLSKERATALRREDLESRIATMEERNSELQDNLAFLSTEEGLEGEIRGKFDVSEEGEHVVVIVEPKPETPSGDDIRKPWYRRFWDAIID